MEIDEINNYFKNKEGHIVQSAFKRIFIRNKFKYNGRKYKERYKISKI